MRWRVSFFLQVIEHLLDHHGIINSDDGLHGAAAFPADIVVDVEHLLEALGPGHGCSPFSCRLWFARYVGLITLAPLRSGD